ncbi:RNA-binding domain-containing protein [Pseudovirgaria hyperparasitica]|uniref:RNA-binding domain-containing protein n=1 Tax=Pseudovirgaria hyperparasitica TaxID=470096 RepID=A0A6A6WAF0_9PEZI|nr:RNA-binding domain-containing protein [Pseudovirgaria hyperparasitica]KAF2758930.1 RNA-binding domain-containing protein [Pseudovirgaria hyperparasitica]
MDRSLDDIVSGRQNNNRSRNRRGNFPRDGVKKPSQRDYPRNLDQDWVHDKYEDDDCQSNMRAPFLWPTLTHPARDNHRSRPERRQNDRGELFENSFKLKVENLHYEISEEDLKELFSRIGRVREATLVYDRQDRSRGLGFVTYTNANDAIAAMNEYNGQKAYGQTIYLTMLPSTSARPAAARNAPSRSLFDRIERPLESRIRRDDRSVSPIRHSDVSGPAPGNIDRYVPGGGRNGGDRRRSPPRRGVADRGGRRPGARRDDSNRRTDGGAATRQGRPRKTQEQLDAEMEDYWGSKGETEPVTNGSAPANGGAAPATDDIDMIE